MKMKQLKYTLLFLLCCFSSLLYAQTPHPMHAVAMHGQPKYPPDFKHLDYVNPKAPKGGSVKFSAIGNFDSFNPYIAKGVYAAGLNLIYDTLTAPSDDEAFTQYGLLAQWIEMPQDRSWVVFHLNPKARFSDGKPVHADDVVFTFNKLIQEGAPFYQFYYANVEKVTALSEHKVKFEFNPGDNRELALIVGQLPVLPKHYWENRDFNKASLEIPMGSGPYVLKAFEPGKRVTYQRRPNYWAKDLPINTGRFNFDKITYEYYLDNTIALEAFKAGQFDFRAENNSKLWATQYTSPAIASGGIHLETIPHQLPAGMQCFAFNLRKPIFQDMALRKAMAYAFDFEWSNKNLFYDQYARTASYFQNTELAATQLPTAGELKVLEPVKDKVPAEVFTQVYEPPKTDGQGKSRKALRQGIRLLKQAGYTVKNNQLYNPEGKAIVFEFLLRSDGGFERIVLPFIKNLETMGIQATVRAVDMTQYVERLRNFDFDMVVQSFGQSLSPGNEQRDYWHSASAHTPDSRNTLGVQDPAIDYLVDQVITAPSREGLVLRTRALDRVLQWNHFVIPNWHVKNHRLAYWEKLKRPETMPPYGLDLMAWWVEPAFAKKD